MRKTNLELKKEAFEKIEPQIKNLIKKYGYENVAYTWTKAVEKQRQIKKMKAEIAELNRKAKDLEYQLKT